MKKELDNARLTYLGVEPYYTPNINVERAEIAKFVYDDGHLYQPRIVDNNGKFIIDRCGYTQKIEAKKAIDNYKL